MKRILFGLVIIGLALGFLTSCEKDNGTEGTVPENGFRATIEKFSGNNAKGDRTHINPSWGTETETDVHWSSGDLIKVANYNGSGSALAFHLAEGENTMYGLFYTGEPHDNFFQPDYVAIYPVANAEGASNTISGTTATFDIPSTQTYKADSFDEGALPMVARSSTQKLNFRNVLGGICIPLEGYNMTVTSVKLTSMNTTEKLWGVFTSDCTSSNPMPTHVSGGDNTLTLDCGQGVALNATTPTDFYFMVPPGTLESGFKITVYNGTNVIYEETADWSESPATGFIPRSVVKKVSTNLSVMQVTTNSPTFITTMSAFTGGKVNGTRPSTCGILYALASDLSEEITYEGFMADADANLRVGEANVVQLDNLPFTPGYNAASYTTEAMTGLIEDCVYVVRAYATNSDGTVFYGEPIPFATRKDYANDYGGMIPYAYSISPTRQVYFSMGNLQWSATGGGSAPTTHATADGGTAAGTWRFAEYQFEFVGNASNGLVYTGGMHPSGNLGVKCNNALIDENYSGWIDLFGWGTSGYHDPNDPSNLHYQPWSTSRTDYYLNGNGDPAFGYNIYGYGPAWNKSTTLTGNYANYDWGVYNAISNGGNTPGQWFTLSGSMNASDTEAYWRYLGLVRPASTVNGMANARYFVVRLKVRNDVTLYAAIFLPDVYAWPSTYVNSYPIAVNGGSSPNNTNNRSWTEAEWSLLEKWGAVIMPTTMFRGEQGVVAPTSRNYHTASSGQDASNRNNCIYVRATTSSEFFALGVKCTGNAVRLVRDAN